MTLFFGGIQICRDPVVDQEGAEAPVEAASEAEASEAADLAVEDTAEAASVAHTAREVRTVREDLISVGASARALADGIAVRTITVAAVLAACSDF